MPLPGTAARRRILIDGRMAANVGGGFTYMANVVPRLARTNPQDEFLVLVRTERLAKALPELPNVELRKLPHPGPLGRLAFTFREGPRLAREWGADAYFSVSEYAPVNAPCPVIASFRNPNVFTPLKQGWPLKQKLRLRTLRGLARLSAWGCDRVMFVSEDSAQWIGDVLGMPESKRAVVHHGIDLSAWEKPPGLAPHPRPYILSVSTIYRYKNFVRLIEGYADLARRTRRALPDLVIAGDDQDPTYSRQMEQARLATGPLADRIHIVGEVPYAKVRDYYAHAALFVFPSYLETFGHPMLEAMASGVPVVASDIPVFRELGGDAAFYVDPQSPPAFASAMHEALFSLEARRALVKRGEERVKQFTWDHTVSRLSALFDEVLERPVRVPARDSQPQPALRYRPAA